MEAMRATLDSLMESLQPKVRSPDDPVVCKHYLCGFCPYEEFRRTKNDVGECPHVHDPAAKAAWDALTPAQRAERPYERDLARWLDRFLADLHRRVQQNEPKVRALNAAAGVPEEEEDEPGERMAKREDEPGAKGGAGGSSRKDGADDADEEGSGDAPAETEHDEHGAKGKGEGNGGEKGGDSAGAEGEKSAASAKAGEETERAEKVAGGGERKLKGDAEGSPAPASPSASTVPGALLGPSAHSSAASSAPASSPASALGPTIESLTAEIESLQARAEAAGEEGDVDLAASLAEQADAKETEREGLIAKASLERAAQEGADGALKAGVASAPGGAISARPDAHGAPQDALPHPSARLTAATRGLRSSVCPVSGLIINDDEARMRDHLAGRNYNAWKKLHAVRKAIQKDMDEGERQRGEGDGRGGERRGEGRGVDGEDDRRGRDEMGRARDDDRDRRDQRDARDARRGVRDARIGRDSRSPVRDLRSNLRGGDTHRRGRGREQDGYGRDAAYAARDGPDIRGSDPDPHGSRRGSRRRSVSRSHSPPPQRKPRRFAWRDVEGDDDEWEGRRRGRGRGNWDEGRAGGRGGTEGGERRYRWNDDDRRYRR